LEMVKEHGTLKSIDKGIKKYEIVIHGNFRWFITQSRRANIYGEVMV
jgi:hypothetical protein